MSRPTIVHSSLADSKQHLKMGKAKLINLLNSPESLEPRNGAKKKLANAMPVHEEHAEERDPVLLESLSPEDRAAYKLQLLAELDALDKVDNSGGESLPAKTVKPNAKKKKAAKKKAPAAAAAKKAPAKKKTGKKKK